MKVARTILVAAALAVAASVPVTAQAAKKHKKHSHSTAGTVLFAGISSMGSPPASGSEVFAGTTAGALGHGATTGTLAFTLPTFAGTFTDWTPHGSLIGTIKGTGSLKPDGSIMASGSGTYTGGTDNYKGASGAFTFTSTTPAAPPGSNQVTTAVITGTVKY